jgi:hypothetical protein
MSVIERLACSLNRRDEVPNQELAKSIVAANDVKGIKELIENLHNKDKNIQSDCIKVLYETGERKPSLISGYVKEFIRLLDDKNNRLQWGAMAALDQITGEKPEAIYAQLGIIIAAAEKGSVITKDHAVNILIKLASQKKYADEAITFLMEQLLNAPTNQLPKYAEDAIPVIRDKYSKSFIKILSGRLAEIEKDTKRKRVEKVIKKLS